MRAMPTYRLGRIGAIIRLRTRWLVAQSLRARVMRMASSEHREPALAGQLVEGVLHPRTDDLVDLGNVRLGPELGLDVDGLEHLADDLRRQRDVEAGRHQA